VEKSGKKWKKVEKSGKNMEKYIKNIFKKIYIGTL
jgi:hypothetical protein